MKSKKIMCILLAAALTLSAAGCSQEQGSGDSTTTSAAADASTPADTSAAEGAEDTTTAAESAEDTTTAAEETPTDTGFTAVFGQEYTDNEIYDMALGEFYDYYTKAEEAGSVSEKYALMAIAEAKMLGSGIFLPLTSQGGNYSIGRIAPYTNTAVLWGNDSDRFHQRLVTTELIKTADRDAMKAKWKELAGTGEYEAWAKQYLQDQGYELKDTLNIPYTSDPTTWDVLATSEAADSEAIVNTYDGLVEYDVEGQLKPALAESYEVSEDGLTYTFHIREGAKWVDSQGREVADVCADDFVAGLQHMMDAAGGLEYLIDDVIVGAHEYLEGSATIDDVGVKAVDEHTLVYTLEAPKSYFITMFGYGVFAPMSRSYYESQGGKFGAEYDTAAADYNYGKTPDNIAYCGPYLVTNLTAENTIVFSANPSYWNADNINVKTITWYFNDSSDVTKTYNDVKSGVLDGAGLNSSTITTAKEEGLFDEYSYVTSLDATTYNGFFNLHRQSYTNFNDTNEAVSTMTDDQKAATNYAMLNQHFRLALCYAIDRGAHNSQTVGEDLKFNSLRNTYVPGTFVQLAEDVTVEINGTATQFKAGTNYGEIVQAQLDADGIAIKAYDPAADGGVGSDAGYDGWFNPDEAKKELELAIEELKAGGLEISADNPVYLDVTYPANIEIYVNRANVLKQCIEENLGGVVKVNLLACSDATAWYYSGYYPETGAEMNYNYCDVAGWGPDYGDPETYLNTLLPDGAGYMTKSLGIF